MEVIAHIYVKYHMASNLLVVGGQIINIAYILLKIQMNIIHLIANIASPKGVTIDTLLGILMPKLCVRVQYLDSTFAIIKLFFFATWLTHHASKGSS